MDLVNLATFQVGERIRLMEVFSLALSLTERKFGHYMLESNEYGIEINIFTDSEKDSKEVQRFVERYLSPYWDHRHNSGVISSGSYWCDSYKYRFWEEEF